MSTISKPSIIPGREAEAPAPDQASFLARLGRKHLLAQLSRLEDGELRILDGGESLRYGQRTARCALSATITVHNPQFYADAAFGGTVGAGEAYIHGLWHCDDLTALVRIMVVNRTLMDNLERGWARSSAVLRRALHWVNRNSKAGSRVWSAESARHRAVAPHSRLRSSRGRTPTGG